MAKETENVSIDEVRRIARTSIEENIEVLNALADYDERQEGLTVAQEVDQYFTIRNATGMNNVHYTDHVTVIRSSITHDLKTDIARDD